MQPSGCSGISVSELVSDKSLVVGEVSDGPPFQMLTRHFVSMV